MRRGGAVIFGALALLLLAVSPARAEDGYELWLRYRPLAAPYAAEIADMAPTLSIDAPPSPVIDAAKGELNRAFGVWLGRPMTVGAGAGQSGLQLCRRDRPCATGLPKAAAPLVPGAFASIGWRTIALSFRQATISACSMAALRCFAISSDRRRWPT